MPVAATAICSGSVQQLERANHRTSCVAVAIYGCHSCFTSGWRTVCCLSHTSALPRHSMGANAMAPTTHPADTPKLQVCLPMPTCTDDTNLKGVNLASINDGHSCHSGFTTSAVRESTQAECCKGDAALAKPQLLPPCHRKVTPPYGGRVHVMTPPLCHWSRHLCLCMHHFMPCEGCLSSSLPHLLKQSCSRTGLQMIEARPACCRRSQPENCWAGTPGT